MTEPDALTLAYLGSHPREAALVLDTLPPPQVAALWAALPARLVAPCAAAMRAGPAGMALLSLPDDVAAALLLALPPAAASAMLRTLRSPRVAAWLALLPSAHAATCQALLRFPADAVGAVTDTAVLCFAADATVAHAREVLQAAEQAQDLVLVDDGAHGLRGAVPVGALLMAHPQDRLHRWCQPLPALPALMPADAARVSAGWRDGLRRPVIEANGRLLGLVSQQALQQVQRAPAAPAPTWALGWLAQGYWHAVNALCEWLVSLWQSPAVAEPPAEAGR